MSKSDTIDAMTAGYWLDELVAWKIFDTKGTKLDTQYWVYPDRSRERIGGFSKDIVSAQKVLKELERKGWEWDIRFRNRKYEVAITRPEWAIDNPYQSKIIPSATADTIPLAICRAAIKVSHHEEYEGAE